MITLGLSLVKNYALTDTTTSPALGTGSTETTVTVNTQEITLSTFLSYYTSGSFEKIILQDYVTLKGLQPAPLPAKTRFRPQATKAYTILEAQMPPQTSLQDLGISTTGATTIEVIYTQQSTIANIFVEHILPIIFFVLVLVVLFRFMSPKGG